MTESIKCPICKSMKIQHTGGTITLAMPYQGQDKNGNPRTIDPNRNTDSHKCEECGLKFSTIDQQGKLKYIVNTNSASGVMILDETSSQLRHEDKPKITELKSSGKKDTFSSGAVRDSIEGKPMMELLPMDLLMRVSEWYGLGAKKYGDDNWRKGQPIKRCVGSILRHLTKYILGQMDEDHLSAIVFNALSIMNVEMYHADDPQLNNMNYQEQVKGDK